MANKKKSTFIKWFITFAAILTAALIAGTQGVFTLVAQNDISHITSVIVVLFVASSFLAGTTAATISNKHDTLQLPSCVDERVKIKQRLNILNFMSNAFFYIGLIGTIVGFCYMMSGTLNASDDVSSIIQKLKVGSSTKLYTTLCGIIASLLLQVQTLIITNALVEDTDEDS